MKLIKLLPRRNAEKTEIRKDMTEYQSSHGRHESVKCCATEYIEGRDQV